MNIYILFNWSGGRDRSNAPNVPNFTRAVIGGREERVGVAAPGWAPLDSRNPALVALEGRKRHAAVRSLASGIPKAPRFIRASESRQVAVIVRTCVQTVHRQRLRERGSGIGGRNFDADKRIGRDGIGWVTVRSGWSRQCSHKMERHTKRDDVDQYMISLDLSRYICKHIYVK